MYTVSQIRSPKGDTMPKTLKLQIQSETFEFSLTKFTKDDIVGKRIREYRAINGNEIQVLQNARIMTNGMHIIPKGGINSQFVNEAREFVSRKDIRDTDEHGEILPIYPSSFDQMNEAESFQLEEFFNFEIEDTYLLKDESLALDNLYTICEEDLTHNRLLRMKYAYFATPFPQYLVLIPKEDKIVACIGEFAPPQFTGSTIQLEQLLRQLQDDTIDKDLLLEW